MCFYPTASKLMAPGLVADRVHMTYIFLSSFWVRAKMQAAGDDVFRSGRKSEVNDAFHVVKKSEPSKRTSRQTGRQIDRH